MRVVPDTNVIVAAFATRGLCTEVLEVCLMDHSIVLSEYILTEVSEKLMGKIHLPRNIVHEIIDYLRNQAELVRPAEVEESICRDKDDVPVLGTALSGNAQFVITGDQDLLVLKKYKEIDIVSPRKFWSLCRMKS